MHSEKTLHHSSVVCCWITEKQQNIENKSYLKEVPEVDESRPDTIVDVFKEIQSRKSSCFPPGQNSTVEEELKC